MFFYYNFRELGLKALKHADDWFTLCFVRASSLKEIRGGASSVARALLRDMFIGPTAMHIPGTDIGFQSLFAKFGALLCDYDGHRSILATKGAAGIRPCILCKNVISVSSDLERRREYLVDIACCDVSKFDLATEEDIAGAIRSLRAAAADVQARRCTKAHFDKMEKVLGVNCSPDGILDDIELQPILAILRLWSPSTLSH